MKNRLTKEEQKTPIGRILCQFEYNDLAEPEIRMKLERLLAERCGKEKKYELIELLEGSQMLPECILP